MKVAIIHPWFPQYRMEFFNQLVESASSKGIEVKIYYGEPPLEWVDRKDTVSRKGFTQLPTKFFRIGKRSINYKSLKQFALESPFDLVIVEQAVRNLETYRLLIAGAPVAFWGHGKTYTERVNSIQEWLKQILTQRGRWFFAYTEGGAESVVSRGFPANRTTIVQNSIDSASLIEAISDVKPAELDKFCQVHELHGKTALFIGGVDSSKRIDFLLRAAKIAHNLDPEFKLIVAGAGTESTLVNSAAAKYPFFVNLGPVFGYEKALALKASEVIAMPGRVGLVVVDSFAAQRPIITTKWPFHAPEFEYLQFGFNAIQSNNDEYSFAEKLINTINDKQLLNTLRKGCAIAASKYTTETMVQNFVSGLETALLDEKKLQDKR